MTSPPLRPDRITIWPSEHETFGLDVLYRGADGYDRAEAVHRTLTDRGKRAVFRQEVDGAWGVRFGPVTREDMLTVLSVVVW